MGTTALINPTKARINIAGVDAFGFPDGARVSLERTEKTFKFMEGSSGDSTFLLQNKKGGKITLRILQTSAYNAHLSALLLQQETSDTPVTFPVLYKDLNTTGQQAIATNCVIEGWPKLTTSDTVEVNEWVILAAELNMNLTGVITL